ncbi:MAG TPA: DUF4396 domain-containing protein [Candidatus Udaeobacter sp.]|nr:DUF4396 domain-containing protein [Candidatus Udaeobacter sp.]
MPPSWLTIIAWFSLGAGFVSAVAVLLDIYVRGQRQPMRVMETVWPITALYFGPLGWFAYLRLGRPKLPTGSDSGHDKPPEWEGAAISATHCGAGCALGDIIGEWVVFVGALTIAGLALWPEYLADFALAYIFGIAFQYFAIKPMSAISAGEALKLAIQSDTLTIIGFEVGMFGWMALVFFVLFTQPHLEPNHPAYWLMMQVAMVIGLLTSYPINVWLIRHGIKHAMHRPTLPPSKFTVA